MSEAREQLQNFFAGRNPTIALWQSMIAVVIKVSRKGGEDLKRWDLSPAQFDVLTQIGKHSGLSQQELAEKLLVTKGNISQLLAKLDKQGLVQRKQDGVSNELYLSNRGMSLLLEMLPSYDKFVLENFAGLTRKERETLLQIMQKLDRSLD